MRQIDFFLVVLLLSCVRLEAGETETFVLTSTNEVDIVASCKRKPRAWKFSLGDREVLALSEPRGSGIKRQVVRIYVQQESKVWSLVTTLFTNARITEVSVSRNKEYLQIRDGLGREIASISISALGYEVADYLGEVQSEREQQRHRKQGTTE